MLSQDGQELFVETDCASNGDCDGSETHLMIFNQTLCGVINPWFDSVTGRCRNDTGS